MVFYRSKAIANLDVFFSERDHHALNFSLKKRSLKILRNSGIGYAIHCGFRPVILNHARVLAQPSQLKRLIKQVDKKIFLIADSHPAHKAKDVKKYLATHKRKIVLFFLLPYSPDLNPSEFINNDAKTNTIRKTRPRTQAQMTSGLRKYLRSKQRTPHKVKKFFHAESVRYAAH